MILGLDRLRQRNRPKIGGMPTFSTVAWLATGMAFATMPFIGRVPWWLLVFVLTLGAWRLQQAWFRRPPPSRWLRHTLSLSVLIGWWASGNIGFGLDAAAPVFVAFLWIKLLELDSERDVLMAAFLGFFLITGVLLTGQSLLLTLQAVMSALVILGAIMWYHTPHLGGAAAVDGSATSALPINIHRGQPPGWGRMRDAHKVFGRVLLLVAQALPFALLLFIFTPRPVLQLSLNSRTATAGISDSLDPGRFASNSKNEQVAFRAEFPHGLPASLDDLYWRGIVLWSTDGNAWNRGPEAVPSNRGVVTRAAPEDLRASRTSLSGGQGRVLVDITLPANPNPWLYTLDTPTGVVNDGMLLPGLVQEWRNGARGTITYRSEGNPDIRPADWGGLARRFALQLPPKLDPRITALASGWRADATSMDQVIDRGVAWFTTNGFLYSLAPGTMGPDATATFLFEKRTGFCGHYAAAFCILMRSAGIPARVVLGYRGGEVNDHGNFLVVRQSQAHAWAEVWTGSELTGWRRIDLTHVVAVRDPETSAASATTAAAAAGATARAHQRASRPWYEQAAFRTRVWYEFVESRWDRWAIGYNSEAQDELLAWLGLDELGSWAHGIGLILGGVVIVAGIAVIAWLWSRLGAEITRTPAERSYRRLVAQCARAGFPRGPAEGPHDHLERVCRAHPAQAKDLRAGLEAWLRTRYGRPTPADRATLAHAVHTARTLPAAFPDQGSTETP
jgi:protein-glutamine gamma-glutamyltransferase